LVVTPAVFAAHGPVVHPRPDQSRPVGVPLRPQPDLVGDDVRRGDDVSMKTAEKR
jgi:hypothetical protein